MIRSFVAIDIETTGLSPDRHHIIEVGALKVRDGMVVDTFSQLINPGYSLPEKIVEITHITDEMLDGKPGWKDICDRLYAFVGEDPLLGHNVAFDYRFLKINWMREGYSFDRTLIDTLKIARQLHQEVSSRSLESMCRLYGLTNESAHRAFEDAKVTMELYFAMMERGNYPSDLDWDKLGRIAPCEVSVKKDQPITARQKNYLNDLLKYHKINNVQKIENLTKSQASRMIDKIILQYGRIQ